MNASCRIAAVAIASLSIVVVDACSHPPPPPPPKPAVDSAAIRAHTADSLNQIRQKHIADSIAEAARLAAAKKAHDDSLAAAAAAARAAALRIQRVNDSTAAAARDNVALQNTLKEPVHFDFDKSDLRDDTKGQLDAKLGILKANPNAMIRITGNTDERGSKQYNLALGQRRAGAAKDYLVQRGIAENRIDIASNGKEHPLCSDKTESCWSQNRRDEFEITAGGNMLRRP